jgi:hypothetical protein
MILQIMANNAQGFLGIKTGMTVLVDKTLGGDVRRPLLPITEAATQELRDGLAAVMKIEASL